MVDSDRSDSPRMVVVVRNTFLELEEQKDAPLRRCNSGSDLSLLSHAPTISELKQWSDTTSKAGSITGGSTPGSSSEGAWADQHDNAGDDNDDEGFQHDEAIDDWVPVPPTKEALKFIEKMQDLAQGRSLTDNVVSQLAQDDTIHEFIPLDPQGHPSSLGSILHGVAPIGANCKPCVFLKKDRCTRGKFCLHCHLPHPTFKAKRLRASKATRKRRAKMWADPQDECSSNFSQSNQSIGSYSSGNSAGSDGSSQSSTRIQLAELISTKISL